MDDSSNREARTWSASPSVRERNAVQRAVTALLDEIVPERLLTRGEQLRLAVEQHRTPTGCVLQAEDAAVSVSWFADTGSETGLGELHILVWRGVVTRRGTRPNPEGATMVKELVLHPVDCATDACAWRSADGTQFDSHALAAHCFSLLEEQVGPSRDNAEA